jgi:dynein light chain LC8-type
MASDGKHIPRPQEITYIIEETEMDDEMIIMALEIVEKNKKISNQELCKILKEEFDSKYYPTWICIVGTNFGCRVKAQKKHYLCFQYDKKIIILYKYH